MSDTSEDSWHDAAETMEELRFQATCARLEALEMRVSELEHRPTKTTKTKKPNAKRRTTYTPHNPFFQGASPSPNPTPAQSVPRGRTSTPTPPQWGSHQQRVGHPPRRNWKKGDRVLITRGDCYHGRFGRILGPRPGCYPYYDIELEATAPGHHPTHIYRTDTGFKLDKNYTY